MLRRWLVGGLSIGLLASVLLAKQGVVTNRQNEKFKGDITEDDKFVTIDGPGGQIKLDKRNVAKIVYAEAVDDEYKARHAKLADNDVKGRIDLAQWANENGRADLAVAALTEARKIDPFNKDAARALDAAQQQLDMDQAGTAKTKLAPGATTVPTTVAGGTPAPTTQAVVPEVPLERRLLNADEINTIRQKEMSQDDPKIRIRFDNNVVKKYVAGSDHSPAEFAKLTPQAQAAEILAHGDKALAKDVKILTDPAPLLEFKQKIQPIIATGCAAAACHGGTKAGNFSLYLGESPAAVYTNFYILGRYWTTVDGVKYLAMDRDTPEGSLILQFGLPHADGKPPHPKVMNLKVRFKSVTDPAYVQLSDWLTKSLVPRQPDYGINVAWKLPNLAASQPATAPAAPGNPPAPITPGRTATPMQPAPVK